MNYLINHVVELEMFALVSKFINSRNIKNVESKHTKNIKFKNYKKSWDYGKYGNEVHILKFENIKIGRVFEF